MRAAVGRVRPLLERRGLSYTVLPVPMRDRGGARRRSWRIATALLRAARMLPARQLVIGEYACWQAGAPTVSLRLATAEGSAAAGGTGITFVRVGELAELLPV